MFWAAGEPAVSEPLVARRCIGRYGYKVSALPPTNVPDKPIEHLAKCAELLHTGAAESAEAECRAAVDESPRSPWPLLISAQLLPFDPFVGDEPSELLPLLGIF